MKNHPLSIYSITALDFARSVVSNRRLAVDISVAQTIDLAGALIQQAETIKILTQQNHALCNELDALTDQPKEQIDD